MFKDILCIGRSMYPTIKHCDFIYSIPYKDRKVKGGDVVLFLSPDGERKVAHRVVHVGPKEIRTRGDNHDKSDSRVFKREAIIGQVVYLRRDKKTLRVYGGPLGQLIALKVRVLREINRGVSFLLGPPYRWLVKRVLIGPAPIRPQVVKFETPNGIELQFLIGRFSIACLISQNGALRIDRPRKVKKVSLS